MPTTTGEPENELSSVWIESPTYTKLKSVGSCLTRQGYLQVKVTTVYHFHSAGRNRRQWGLECQLIYVARSFDRISSGPFVCVCVRACEYTLFRTENVITLYFLTLRK